MVERDKEKTADYKDGYDFGWQLSEDVDIKRNEKTMTEDDVLALGNMFIEFCEKAEKDIATPYESGFIEGVSAYGAAVESGILEAPITSIN